MSEIDERLAKMSPLQRAIFALKETQNRLDALEKQQSQPIAIVGMACRFPGDANDPRSYWELLRNGIDAISETPLDRWDVDAFYDPDANAPGKMNTRWGGFLRNIDEFDNHFFSISDREAMRIDPQHRMLLELTWEAIEDSGLRPSSLRGARAGVFIGISHSEYGMMLSTDLAQTDAYVSTGTADCMAAGRIAYAFDFRGPSIAVDTACSSSLVAIHFACQSLRNRESDIALAGGANLLLSPMATINLTKAGFSTPDGRVRAFDASAAGYVRGEGAGVIVLKPLDAAIRDGDPIYAVIRGSAVNQNGFSNGLTAPSRQAQERILRQSYAVAERSPAQVQYVETQGTGTRLGDAIEASALGQVLRQDREPGSRCAIGSVKTNLGHLESASGVASIIKVAMAMQHGELPASLHFKTPNPDIPFDELPLRVQDRLEPWPASEQARLAGVSAFGFGGSNAHVVLEEAPAAKPRDKGTASDSSAQLLLISARTDNALRQLADKYTDFLKSDSSSWRDICYTAAARRDHHDCRVAILASSPSAAADAIRTLAETGQSPAASCGRKPFGRELKPALHFDGQTEAWRKARPQLARLIADWNSKERTDLDAAAKSTLGHDIAAILADDTVWEARRTAIPAMVALQLLMTTWWRSRGFAPQVVVGESAGEFAAACAAGILTVEETLRIAAESASGETSQAASAIVPRAAAIPFLSAVDGQARAGADLNASYWQRCIREQATVNSAAMKNLASRQIDVCLSIGSPLPTDETSGVSLPFANVSSLASEAHETGIPWSAIGQLYAAGVDFSWDHVAPEGGCHVSIPTYAWQRQRLWATSTRWEAIVRPKRDSAVAETKQEETPASEEADPLAKTRRGEIRQRPELNTPCELPRTALETALARSWSEILRIEPVGIHDNFFELGGDSLQATILLNRLQDQLGEIVHVLVLFRAQTIHDLAEYLRQSYPEAVRRLYPGEIVPETKEAVAEQTFRIGDEEVEASRRLADSVAPNRVLAPITGRKNRRAVFVLSPARSGTTLLRVMLAGHPRLFSPPELELMAFDTMTARQHAYEGVEGVWLDGAVRALMEATNCSLEEARATVSRMEANNETTQQFYRILQDSIGDRWLVDKTPSYSGQLHALSRIEEMFDEPLYIHLLRHPCGMIHSFVDYRLHLTYDARYKIKMQSPFSPQQIAELVWIISHQNIVQALRPIPADRCHRLRFEDMVTRPEETMVSLCEFLGLEYHADMIHPYENRDMKMTDGVTAEGRMQGDQKFIVKHKSIDPSVAYAWRKHMGTDFLGPPARRLAAEFGYEDVETSLQNSPPAAADQKAPLALVTGEAEPFEATDLLERLDDLSDDEVLSLLKSNMDDEALHD